MAENGNGDLVYEADESGQWVLVRSHHSSQRVYVRFTNRTSRPIDVWWRNFDGVKQHYVRLDPGKYFDVNTYITHPWEFTDATTKERYVINNKPIYRAPANIGGMMYRTNWNVTVSVRSLRKTVLLYIALRLSDRVQVASLDLPQVLVEELEEMIDVINHDPSLQIGT